MHTHLGCQKKRRKRRGSTERRGQIIGRVCITERPEVVENRSRIGDWEADSVIGKQGGAVLVMLAERKSRFSMILKVEKSNGPSQYCDPYHSWERGLNENTNGLICQYLPKGKSFDDLTGHEVQNIMAKLNNRHRKCLGFRTPNQVFIEAKSHVALES